MMYGAISAGGRCLSIHYVWFAMARLTRDRFVEEGLRALEEDGPAAGRVGLVVGRTRLVVRGAGQTR